MHIFHITEQDGTDIHHAAADFSPVVSGLIAGVPEDAIIEFAPGVYHFWPERAEKRTLYLSNTDSAEFPVKHIGILAENKKNLTLRGKSASLIFHGNILALAFLHCSGIRLEGFQIDYDCPSTIDATVEKITVEGGCTIADVRFPDVYTCETDGGKVHWKSEISPYTGKPYWTGCNGLTLSQHFSKDTGFVRRTEKDLFYQCRKVDRLSEQKLRFSYTSQRAMGEGDVFQMRHTIRDACGLFFAECSNISLEQMEIGYMYGIGIVCQCTDTLNVEDVRFRAWREGRMTASAADFLQVSGCKGMVRVHGCTFVSPHDDPVNIHGTFLKAAVLEGCRLKLKYAHPQTLGFASAYPGDLLQFYDADTLLPFDEPVRVLETKGPGLEDPTSMEVVLERECTRAEGIKPVVENISWTPEVVIEQNLFEAVPTRGVLVSTQGKVVIRDNVFSHIEMAAIFISGDANSWYESGPVRDVLIENNRFLDCRSYAVLVEPTNTVLQDEEKVHSNIRVVGNEMTGVALPIASFKSTEGALVEGNRVECCSVGKNGESLAASISSDVKESDNIVVFK